MPNMTLLEIVQDILNEMDSDSVNSISDTAESMQVAGIVKNTYYNMISNRNWPHLQKFIQLEALGDTSHPNYLKIPDNVQEVKWLKYDKKKSTDTRRLFEEVEYIYPDEFVAYTNTRNTDNANVVEISDFGGGDILIRNDTAPAYYTSFDDEYLVFDSYDSDVESTMQASKSNALVIYQPTWTATDVFIPDLPTDAFMELVEEAKSTAFLTLKQMANEKSEQKAVRQRRWMSRKGWRAKGGIRYANYGRQSKYSRDISFKVNKGPYDGSIL